jgi:hypothetical protein
MVGEIDGDGIQFQLDETKNTYMWKGEATLGYGIHRIVRDTDMNEVETLHDVQQSVAGALFEFNKLAVLIKAGAFKSN